jgi:hypothetical protein
MTDKHSTVPGEYALGWLESMDARYSVTHELRGRYMALADDLGGLDSLSYQQRSLCERAVWLEYWLAKQERALGEEREFNVGTWVQGSNALLGLYRHLGIARKARTVPDIREYLRQKEQEATVAAGS